VDGAGGPDEIWILSDSNTIETTVDGGTGDDTIHIGGAPPILVFDPPSFTYTPPAFTVTLPPTIAFDPATINLDGFTFNVSLDTWLLRGGLSTPATLAETMAHEFADHLGNVLTAIDPLIRVDAPTISGFSSRLRYDF